MRKVVLLVGLASVCLACCCFGAQPVPRSPWVTSATADLNGDKKKEAISLKLLDEHGGYELHIGGAKIKGSLDGSIDGFEIVDIDRHDKYREVAVHTPGPSDDDAYALYWYDGKVIKYMDTLETYPCFHGNGDVTVADWLGSWAETTLYRLDRATHTLKEIPQPYRYVGVGVTVGKPLTLYLEQNTKHIVVTLPKGAKVTLLLASDHWFLVKTHSDLLGWMPATSLAVFEDLPCAD